MDVIKRSDAIKVIDETPFIRRPILPHYLKAKINKIPSAGNAPTIEPKQGEWIDMGDFEQCSVCKDTHLKEFQSYYGKTTWIKTPYCPNCGCRMEIEE